METRIEWTHWPGHKGVTLNPIVGCSKISEGCDNCYAIRNAWRLAGNPNPAVRQAYEYVVRTTGNGLDWSGEVRFRPEVLDQGWRWRKPRCIFWCSMSDLFHPNVKAEWLDLILRTMMAQTEHRHIVLTKRPVRMFDAINFFIDSHFHGNAAEWLVATPHIAWGITAENQARLIERWYWLQRIPVAMRFVSLEPLLGPVDLRSSLDVLDWVIVGGETGPGARPMNPDWVRGIRDQCKQANVPFFFKQWGEWLEWDFHSWDPGAFEKYTFEDGAEGRTVSCVGRKLAGWLLDGQEHKEFPKENKSWRLKEVLRAAVAEGRATSLRAVGRAAGVSTTSCLEYLNGTRDLSTEKMRKIVAYVRDELGIKTPWHELEELVPDDEATGRRKEFGERLSMTQNGGHSRDGCATNQDRRRLMISKEVREAFGLRRDPFSHDVEDADGVLLGPVHKRVHDEMFDAAKYGRFAALIAEVGWGKTILRKLLMQELAARGHRICLVEQLDRENLTISRIQDALLSDFAGTHAENMGREAKSRKIKEMLTVMHEQDKPCPVLMIDEAHALHPSTLRGLKRLYEIEDGFVKLLSIVLFGQPQMFSRLGGYDLEEVTGRLDIVLAYGLDRLARQGKGGPEPHKIKRRGSYVPTYLAEKLKRAGARDPEKVIDAEAMQAIANITDVPLRINTCAARAINHAHRLGYATVTREIIEQLASGEEAK